MLNSKILSESEFAEFKNFQNFENSKIPQILIQIFFDKIQPK